MKTTVSEYEFIDAFTRIRPDNFSFDGLAILFKGLEEFEADTGEEMELDVIAICCDFCEMTLDEVHLQYTSQFEHLEDDQKPTLEQAIEALSNQTWVLGSTDLGTIVFRQF